MVSRSSARAALVVNVSGASLSVTGASLYEHTPGAASDAGTILAGTLPIAYTGVGSGEAVNLTGTAAAGATGGGSFLSLPLSSLVQARAKTAIASMARQKIRNQAARRLKAALVGREHMVIADVPYRREH